MEHHHQPLYRFVLRDALLITWRNKFLWFLGFFVALLGNGGAYEIIIRGFDRAMLRSLLGSENIPSVFRAFDKLKDLVLRSASIKPLLEFVLIIAGLIILVALYFLFSSAAMAATILAVKKLLRKQQTTLLESVRASLPHLIHVFSINVLVKILVSLVIAGSALPLGLFLVKSKLVFGLFYIITFIVLISLGLAASFLAVYAACNSVFQENHVGRAIYNGWKIFTRHIIINIEMALVLFFLNLTLTLVLLTILVSVGGVFGFVLTLLAAGSLKIAFWIVTILAILFFACLFIAAGSFFGAFQLISWTILYTKLIRGEAVSKIVRVVAKLPSYLKLRQT